jgi:nucleotide-binding universal stress UspA family protein
MFKRVLVATDGSDPAKNALQYVLDNAPESAHVVVITVTEKVKDREDFSRVFQHGESDKLYSTKVLEECETMVNKNRPDMKGKYLLKEGKIVDMIVDTADDENVDIIVMGSRGIGGVEGWMLGSTSKAVVNECRKPILILK